MLIILALQRLRRILANHELRGQLLGLHIRPFLQKEKISVFTEHV
jgi:hypothetical protein